jgi:uncharacterized protein YndB with AHSA1/START domain
MSSIRVERTLDAPIDGVFEVLADHANYDRFGGIRRAELLRPGTEDRNGVGALRRVTIGPLTFDEEITAYEPPHRLDYLIVKLNLPYEHKGGSVRLEPDGDGRTHAVWTSEYEIPAPLVGGLAERAFALFFGRGFGATLEKAGEVAAATAPSPA